MSEALRDKIEKFLTDLRDPEVYGHAVSDEVRKKARDLSRALLTDEAG